MSLTIKPHWEFMRDGSPEEKASFAALELSCGEMHLVECIDPISEALRDRPLLSAYHLAEWLVANWWRIFFEFGKASSDWQFSHKMTSIGGGYVWPNLTISSDGIRLLLRAEPSSASASYRYISNGECAIPVDQAEQALGSFIESVVARLDAQGVPETNLHVAWRELARERGRDAFSKWRKVEAALGHDIDDATPSQVEPLLSLGKVFGLPAVLEMIAQGSEQATMPSLERLRVMLDREGAVICTNFPPDRNGKLSFDKQKLPWAAGEELAKSIRKKMKNPDEKISSKQLALLMGFSDDKLRRKGEATITFSLREDGNTKAVLKGVPHEVSRRFELSRLLGDMLAFPGKGHFVTSAYTFRQQLQRAFAAEFLSPYGAVREYLGGDLSAEKQEKAAEHFHVSPMTIATQLVNNGALHRDALKAFA